MLTYYNLANSGLPQGNPLSKLFSLKKISIDNIQFSAHRKKLVKTNKNHL